MTQDEARTMCELAIGRLLRLGSRPEQPGDIEQYHQCRAIVLDLSPIALGYTSAPDYSPNYSRDHNKGAQGQ